jgi:hypothetical protein
MLHPKKYFSVSEQQNLVEITQNTAQDQWQHDNYCYAKWQQI